ncbi:hypothetical protein IV203_029604 [Nitzschia inconspicua]|uniref:Uncharacterized protein n=1 Tax=Nitzschia inconspicua TaxID=303405 RepID=A0A9K3LQX2_9STRA|nr:hypothetical protein IV203_029604 [Nitzschia inconspicua]
MNSSESVISPVFGESKRSLADVSLIVDKSQKVLVSDNYETTIFADHSELSPFSLNSTLKGSKTTCSPKSAYFLVKLPLKLAESQYLRSIKLERSYKSRMDQPPEELNHRSTMAIRA